MPLIPRVMKGDCKRRLSAQTAGALLLIGGAAAFYLGSDSLAALHGAEAIPECKVNLKRQMKALDVPGLAAAIVKDGKIACVGAAGMANIEEDIPVTPNTLFMVASISKTVTATALMQLHERGKFGLDDDINDYLPFEVRVPASPQAPITFRQLLTHTASIKDNDEYINCADYCEYGTSLIPFVTAGADSSIPLADFTRNYLTPDGAYYDRNKNFEPNPPGTVGRYSNMGTVLAGYLVEIISGTPFDVYCREHIFQPLGMNTTSWRLAEIDDRLLAMPYDKNASHYVPYGQYGEVDYPDGMLRTSVEELARFLIAYMEGGSYGGKRILETKTVRDMVTSQTSLDDAQGLIWYKESAGKRSIWGHAGSDNGASAGMWFDPERNAGVIVMANGVLEDAGRLIARLFHEADNY